MTASSASSGVSTIRAAGQQRASAVVRQSLGPPTGDRLDRLGALPLTVLDEPAPGA